MCLGDERKNTRKGLFFQDIDKIFLNIFPSGILIQPLENLELLTPPLPPCQFEMCKVSKPSDKLAASIMLGGS